MRPRAPLSPARVACIAMAMTLAQGCAATIARDRRIVRDVDFHGVRNVDVDGLRSGIATQETPQWPAQRPRWLRWWRWWWTQPSYLDAAAAVRDRLRIARFYEARGYYAAQVTGPEVTDVGDNRVRVGFTVREGDPVRVADIRLRGCGAEGVPQELCASIWRALTLRVGMPLDEERLAADRAQVRELMRLDGWATPLVTQRAMVDPERRRVWLEYSVDRGSVARSRIGRIRLMPASGDAPFNGTHLRNGLPVAPIRSALGIETGDPYSRAALATAQQSLFDLGAFSIARIDEVPRADGTVDLDVRLAPSRLWRFRLGGGFEFETARSNVHGLVAWEHRNLLQNFRRLRLEVRPQLFFIPSLFELTSIDDLSVAWGIAAAASIDQPELLRHTAGTLRTQFELAPDPVNPNIAFRRTTRVSFGLERRFTASLTGSASVRFVDLGFEANDLVGGDPAQLERDPIFRQQFFNQRWIDLEQTITWDRRDDRAQPHRGHYVHASLRESVRSPVSDYTFVRAQVEARGYIPLGRRVTVALRGSLGLAVGETYFANGRWYWPVPPEQRFFLGGTQTLRGYPFNRVGPLTTLPIEATTNDWRDDSQRYVALGGTAMWLASAELRWQPGAFGVVLFAEAGNVAGFDPEPFVTPRGRAAATCTSTPNNPILDGAACDPATVTPPAAPPPVDIGETMALLVQRAHPVAGIGLRYQTPIGPIRLDVGFRLDDLGCTRAPAQIAAQNAAAPSGRPLYYVTTAPRCDFFGFAAPAAINLSVGEAF